MKRCTQVCRKVIQAFVIGVTAACGGDTPAALSDQFLHPAPTLLATPDYTEVSVAPILFARDINDKGVVAGGVFAGGAHRAAVRYPDGRVVDLGVLPGDNWSAAVAINNKGQVVGHSANDNTAIAQAFIWDAEQGMRWLGTLGGGADYPSGINDRGVVVGTSRLVLGSIYPQTAFLWQPNVGITDLGALIGDQSGSDAQDINVLGMVFGTSVKGAFLWQRETGTRFLSFPPGTLPGAINRQGALVGSFYDATLSKNQAFRWSQQKGFVSLGPVAGEWGGASAIGDDGTVAGHWLINGIPRAFVGKGDLFYMALGFSLAEGVNNCGVASGVGAVGGGVIWVPRGRPLTGACS